MSLAFFLLVLSACTSPAGPQEIATQFWRAMIAGESERVSRLVREADRRLLESGLTVLPILTFELGRIVITDQRAEIETRVEVNAEAPMNLQLTTVLVRTGRDWRVDYAASVDRISRDSDLAKVLEQLQRLGARVGADLNRSLEELKSAVPKLESELSNIEKEFRETLPELRKRLEELGKNLHRSPSALPPPPDYRKAI